MDGNRPDFFEKNCIMLEKTHPHVWQLFAGDLPAAEGEIILAANGKPNLWTTDQNGNCGALHLLDDPEAETSQFLDMVLENFEGTVTITGMGLGYTPLALIKHRPNIRYLAVFEPNPGIFLQALHALDLTPLLGDPRTILGIGPEQNIADVMSPANTALQLESICNLQHLPSFSLNFVVYKQIHQAVWEHCSSFNIEGNTLDLMGRYFLENRLRHLNSMHHNRLLSELEGRFKNIPAIIVSAGPSLDKNVHLLAQAKGKAVILAVDSALPTLVRHEIMPDFLGAIDPDDLIYEKVASVAPKVHDVSLICMSWVSSKVVKLFPADQIFWGFGSKPIDTWMSSLFGNQLRIGAAGSVAHLNLLAAIIMECSPIIFIGQDLSYALAKSHSSDTILQINDFVSALLADESNAIWLDGIEGGKVLSDRPLHSTKLIIERIIREQKGHYINATEGGCHIEGTEVMPLQQALDQYCIELIDLAEVDKFDAVPDKTELINHLLNEFRKITRQGLHLTKMLDKGDQLATTLRQWLVKAKKGGKTYRSFVDLPASIQKRVTELDKINKQLDGASLIWSLLQEVTMTGLRQSEQQKHAIALMANDPKQYTEWIGKNVDRLFQISKVRREVLPLLINQLSTDINLLQAEERLLKGLKKEKNEDLRTEKMLELTHLYFGTDNLNVARPWIEELHKRLPGSAESNFLLGWMAAHNTEFNRAEALFKKAAKANPEYAEQIALFRQKQGDAYVRYATTFAAFDKLSCRRLLAKGLLYAPGHPGLKKPLIMFCDQALAEIKKLGAEGDLGKVDEISNSWLSDLAANDCLGEVLGPERTAPFHRGHGLFLADRGDYAPAAAAFANALRLTPDDPALHISITDMYFALEKYPQGIAHLEHAVGLDSSYAVYWEEVGDLLAKAEQQAEAISAYEKCFTILPERIHLLKKMGDCYLASGQLEAAKEAYLQLKTKMLAIDAVSKTIQ